MSLSVGFVMELVRSFSFVFELGCDAFGGANVGARAKVNRLVNAAGFLERVQVAALHHGSRCRNFMVGWDGYIASRAHLVALEQDQRDAPFIIHLGDDERGGFVELVFELVASAVGATGGVRRVLVFEHNAFFPLAFKLLEPASRLSGEEYPHLPDMGMIKGVEHVAHPQIAHREGQKTHVLRADGEQVEGVEGVSYRFTVDQEAARVFGRVACDLFRNGGGESQAVNACDLVAVFFDEQPTAIELLLHPVVWIEQKLIELLFVDGIEELALNAGVFVGRVRSRSGSSVGSRLVALRHLFPDEFVVDVFGNRIFDRRLRFAACAECGTATAISEVYVITIILG